METTVVHLQPPAGRDAGWWETILESGRGFTVFAEQRYVEVGLPALHGLD